MDEFLSHVCTLTYKVVTQVHNRRWHACLEVPIKVQVILHITSLQKHPVTFLQCDLVAGLDVQPCI
jgi:hypothetical protein